VGIAFAHDFLLGDADMPKHYTVSDGDLVLFLWPAEEGGYNVTSPLDPALITQAESVEEAFVQARDVLELLNEVPVESCRVGGAKRNPPTGIDL
jgi:predicted RNase H-like HicB family nuclease